MPALRERLPAGQSGNLESLLRGARGRRAQKNLHGSREIPINVNEPDRLKRRPHHGPFPIPYVTYVEASGRPDFRIHDNSKRLRIARRNLCQLCGETLEDRMVFIGHEGSIERGTFGEPPMHEDCAEYAWEVCPWLAGADWRLDYRAAAKGLTILPQPPGGELGIWITDGYIVVPDDEGGGLVKWKPNSPSQEIQWRYR